MQGEQNKPQLTEEETEAIYNRQRPIALNIAREAVKLANLPQKPVNDGEFTNQRWQVSYIEINNNVVLTVQLNTFITRASMDYSLVLIAWAYLVELESLFSNPRAMEILAVEESEQESTIFQKAVELTRDYIQYLPMVLFHSIHQAFNESSISHIKKIVDYTLRDYLEEIGKPNKKFTLLPNNNLSDFSKLFPSTKLEILNGVERINEELSAYRKGAFSDRKVWLNNRETFLKLPADYEQLQLDYRAVKKEYKTRHEAYFLTNRRAKIADWEKHWKEFCDEEYPNLFFTSDVQSFTASQLAYRQLGDFYGFSADYMEKLVRNAREQLKTKEKMNIKKTDK
jgi:hypothetical protein